MRHLMHRSRLVDVLDREIAGYKLVVVSTPAGYGKTTLLSQWDHVRSAPVTWLCLDEDDNDPDCFCRYLVAA